MKGFSGGRIAGRTASGRTVKTPCSATNTPAKSPRPIWAWTSRKPRRVIILRLKPGRRRLLREPYTRVRTIHKTKERLKLWCSVTEVVDKIVEENPAQFVKFSNAPRLDYRRRCCIWLYGPTGSGKTRLLYDQIAPLTWDSPGLYSPLCADQSTFALLLRLLDGYPLKVETKHCDTWWNPDVVVVPTLPEPTLDMNAELPISEVSSEVVVQYYPRLLLHYTITSASPLFYEWYEPEYKVPEEDGDAQVTDGERFHTSCKPPERRFSGQLTVTNVFVLTRQQSEGTATLAKVTETLLTMVSSEAMCERVLDALQLIPNDLGQNF
ncbi:hypothetical protein BLNAU_7588 [Blattamonas nauphoetae]|uniref:Uncharacterized protein n=1 Tax=Blattamonas nauphoetae TaxID=2049346 RepID=A0ABQ9Y117_9EUKA|nr:hypothetical protein BLNAU_7588 [Blattamonas nauphoetae]